MEVNGKWFSSRRKSETDRHSTSPTPETRTLVESESCRVISGSKCVASFIYPVFSKSCAPTPEPMTESQCQLYFSGNRLTANTCTSFERDANLDLSTGNKSWAYVARGQQKTSSLENYRCITWDKPIVCLMPALRSHAITRTTDCAVLSLTLAKSNPHIIIAFRDGSPRP